MEYPDQQIPGIQVCHSAAVCCSDRIRTGGIAVLLPPGWKMLEELELVPGRAVGSESAGSYLSILAYVGLYTP